MLQRITLFSERRSLMNIELVRDDITKMSVDAIVLPANKYLIEGSGASAAIFGAAGRRNLREACRKIGYCEVGRAVTTSAFALNADYIVHAVVPKWIDGNHNEYELLKKTYNSALKAADLLGCRSIAFPVLAVGNNGFSRSSAVRIAVECLKNYDSFNLERSVLVAYSHSVYNYMINNDYDVVVNEKDFFIKDENNNQRRARIVHMLNEGKEVVGDFIEETVQAGIDYLKEEEVRKNIINTCVWLVGAVAADLVGKDDD